jgi:hypothetical protein
MAEEFLRAELEYWWELGLLSGQRARVFLGHDGAATHRRKSNVPRNKRCV